MCAEGRHCSHGGLEHPFTLERARLDPGGSSVTKEVTGQAPKTGILPLSTDETPSPRFSPDVVTRRRRCLR